jgi:hypothetical protein
MQCLLFCPDEKLAGVLIPLVQRLEMVVRHETQVFSAMRTLMAERFDFLIIDYEDEQTGRILLKNARSSLRNKAALAVAVVNPETGANSLRLGADFLVTRPINLGQAEGILRLVRSSLLRGKVLSAESAGTVSAAEAPPLTEEAASFRQTSNAQMADGLVTTKADLAASVDSSSLETSFEGSSDLRANLSSAPLLEPENTPAVQTAIPMNAPPEQSNMEPSDVPDKEVTKVETTSSPMFLVSLAALGIILLLTAVIAWHVHHPNLSADRGTTAQSAAANSPTQAEANPPESTPPAPVAPKPQVEELTTKAPDPPTIVPRELSIKATPQATRTRTTQVARVSQPLRTESSPLTATVSLNSNPPNAAVWMDGNDTGRTTPAQISVDKPGTHIFVFKKQGYLDETTTANLRSGQTFDFSPSLRALGYTDEIKMVGTFRTIFGRGQTAGQGIVSIKTEPKGAQIAVNARTINKPSPAAFYLNPGSYTIDITIAGFKSIHRVVTVDEGGKIMVDEVMEHE